jgi:hypothetical protein
MMEAPQLTQHDVDVQRQRVAALDGELARIDDVRAADLRTLTQRLVRRSVWIVEAEAHDGR